MFLEVIHDLYDVNGRRAFQPHLKKRLSHPTFPFGRYVSRPLQVHCSSLQELRAFLKGCKQASDKETFGKDDYWLPPDEFEKSRKGDCDDFALWTWRQLIQMGYKARFVAGRCGRFKEGHAWVTFEMNTKHYIADGTLWPLGMHLPTIYNLKYHPIYSVEWNGEKLLFYSHADMGKEVSFGEFISYVSYVPDWLLCWTKFWARSFYRLPLFVFRYIKRRLKFAAPKITNNAGS
jgi:hypothetical protein